MKKAYIISFFIFSFSFFIPGYGQTVYRVLASVADSYVVNDNDTNYALINTKVPLLNKLLLFLPGTGAVPADYYYFLQTAANMGYHTIGLAYNNDNTIGSLCAGQASTCQGSARAEVFYGKNYSSVETVDSSESIRTRLVALLTYLEKNYPSENWNQFLTSQDSVVWAQVCVSGHSQGAGMASLIAYWYPVYRGVFLATGGDWDASIPNVAAWMEMASKTEPSKKYSFTHRKDELFWGSLNEAPVIWDTLGIGGYIDYDTLTGNYHHAHSFTSYDSTGIPASALKYHNCVAVSYYTPLSAGKPLFQPLWQYMLGDTTSTATGVRATANKAGVAVYPNPNKGKFQLQMVNGKLLMPNTSIEIYNLLGQQVYSQFSIVNSLLSINLSTQPNGIYLYRVISESGELIGEGKLVVQK